MREMKDSGLNYLGEIPSAWMTRRLKSYLAISRTTGRPDAKVLSLYRDYGIVPKDSRDDNHNVTSLDTSKYKFVEVGDFVINKMKGWQGSMALSAYEGIVSPACHVFKFINSALVPRYAHYLLRCCSYADEWHKLSTGLRVGQWDLHVVDFLNTKIPLPPLDEQHRIADYLDEKCDEIDRAVSAAEQSIEECKAYRKGLIDSVSVHGLNCGVVKKGIGIPYVDWIPAHWGQAKFRFLLTEFVDCPHETPQYSPAGEYCVIRAGDQIAGSLVLGNMLRLEEDEYERRTRRLTLEKNDIVYGREGNWGKASLVPESDRYCLGQRMMQFRCNETLLHPMFAAYILNANYVYEQGRKDEVGSTSRHVNISTIAAFRIVLPPLDEQRRIADYLDEKCAQIDAVIVAKQAIIADLKAYKQSLIYETVTGKREV